MWAPTTPDARVASATPARPSCSDWSNRLVTARWRRSGRVEPRRDDHDVAVREAHWDVRTHYADGEADRAAPLDEVRAEVVEHQRRAVGSFVVDGIEHVPDVVALDDRAHDRLGQRGIAEWDREHVPARRPEHAADFGERAPRVGHVLHHVAADDEIE